MEMTLEYIPSLKPSVSWKSDDGEWRFHVFYDPKTLEPEKVFYKNTLGEVGSVETEVFRLTRRSNADIRAAVIAAIGDGSSLPRLKREGKLREKAEEAAEPTADENADDEDDELDEAEPPDDDESVDDAEAKDDEN